MSLERIYSLYRTLEEDKILLSFNGVVTAEFLTAVLEIMESKMDLMAETPKIKKKVFNVLVECLQNLFHHVEEGDKGENKSIPSKSALVMVAKENGNFYIKTGNYVDKECAGVLAERLAKINSMDKELLRDYYREVLQNGTVSEKGTAGLGMIDIARKSGNKLEYEFLDIDKDCSFFSLNVKID